MTRPVLAIGPANHAGQADAWCAAVRENLAADAWSFGYDPLGPPLPFRFAVDRTIGKYSYRNPVLRGARSRAFFRGATHIALDGHLPCFHMKRQGNVGAYARQLAEMGYRVALIAHGSDVRDPDLHMNHDPWSYFRDGSQKWLDSVRELTAYNRAMAESLGFPVFYSTPDLAVDLPTATWLPVCLDVTAWRTDAAVLERTVPRVLHVPSNSAVKGTPYIEPILQQLAANGIIEYISPRSLPHSKMRRLVWSCDVVVDQILLGSYGVAAVEAMAAGRVVVGRVRDDVKARLPQSPHIVDATPADLAEVMLSILERREELRAKAAENVAYVRRWHDGRESALRLAGYLGVETD